MSNANLFQTKPELLNESLLVTRKKTSPSTGGDLQKLDSEIGVSVKDARIPTVDEAVAVLLVEALLARHLHIFDVSQHHVFWWTGGLAHRHLQLLFPLLQAVQCKPFLVTLPLPDSHHHHDTSTSAKGRH